MKYFKIISILLTVSTLTLISFTYGSSIKIPSSGPKNITRNIIQDRKGNIWIAAFDGIFKYDGKSFTNITDKISKVRYFSVLEDRKDNFWFGSIGSGVFRYNGTSFRNFTTKDGLAGNDVTCIYQDRSGNIWFGSNNGASCYNGKFFRNLTTKEGPAGKDINSICEDKTGNIWFGTTGYTYIYNGKTFTTVTGKDRKPFKNVRSITEDKKGNTWLGGSDGLWRYNGSIFTNFTHAFVGCVIEDRKGNIWISSEKRNSNTGAFSTYDKERPYNRSWALYEYDEKSLSAQKPTVKQIDPNAGMICGILEANDGSIWFGASAGVYRYDGSTITSFNGEEIKKYL